MAPPPSTPQFHLSNTVRSRTQLIGVLLFSVLSLTASQSAVTALPGFPGTLPFKLETGYVSARESGDVQLFYYFSESERDPENDPLVYWLSGGPGCSSLGLLTSENGPFRYRNLPLDDDKIPQLELNPYSWTKFANLIYVDLPAGTGFSYATTSEANHSSDTSLVKDGYDFIIKWLNNHPKFARNPFYIAGQSYSGTPVPMLVLEILKGNEAGHLPHIPLQGYLLGNPVADFFAEKNSRIPFAHRMGLLSDEYYESAKNSCNGNYINPDRNNLQCIKDLEIINKCIARISLSNVLEPFYDVVKPKHHSKINGELRRNLEASSSEILSLSKQQFHMRKYLTIEEVWANDPNVQEALHVRKGMINKWMSCNYNLSFEGEVFNVIEYHRLLSHKCYRVLIYSGDHDMLIPTFNTLSWIRSLNLTLVENWRPWFVNNQVAGFTEKYKGYENGYNLTFVTVKGAGHSAPVYQPKECFAMFERWFSYSEI